MSERRGGWRRLTSGVRFRTTFVAIAVVGGVLGLATYVLGQQTRIRVERSITSSADGRAADLAELIEAGRLESALPSGSRDLFAQVLDADGNVVATEPGLEEVVPFAAIFLDPGQVADFDAPGIFEQFEDDPAGIEDEGPYRVVARGALSGDGPVTVLVAGSLEPAEKAVGAIRPLLLVGLPLVLIAVGVTVWLLTGRALRPVERMRSEAEAISASELARRLPVPESHDEVRRLADTLNDMLQRLEDAAVRQRRFVADASHELKSPLATIRAMLDIANEDPDYSDWRQLLADLGREDARLESLVGDLLALARFDEGASAAAHAEVDLDQVLGKVAESVRAGAGSVTIDVSGVRPARIWGDESALRRLFRNLIDNGARFARSAVRVTITHSDGVVLVRVADDGPGIAVDDRERVFERFVRLDEARSRSAGGTGLGLAVARAIARAHGGEVRVADGALGAVLEVRLPGPSRPPG